MKKLLVLLLMMLVMGAAFAVPVHINGPGGFVGDLAESQFPELFNVTETGLSHSGMKAIRSSADVLLAGGHSGLYNELRFSGNPFDNLAETAADGPINAFGDIAPFQFQEVLSLSGYIKPSDFGMTAVTKSS